MYGVGCGGDSGLYVIAIPVPPPANQRLMVEMLLLSKYQSEEIRVISNITIEVYFVLT